MESVFYKDKFFYILLVLIFSSFGSYAYTNQYAEKIVNAMVTSDRLRQDADKEIIENVQVKVDTINDKIFGKLDILQKDISDLKVSVAKIK